MERRDATPGDIPSLGWKRSLAAVPLVVGGIFALQASEYLLLMSLPVLWYHVVTALIQAAIVLALVYLYWGWECQAEETRQAYERLAKLERLRDDMTAMLVHDLRNPLTVIGATLDILLARPEVMGQLTQNQSQFLTGAARSQRHLAGMIDDIVDVASAETTELPMELSTVEVCQMTRQAVQDVWVAAESKQLKLLEQYADSLTVVGDPKKLRRVLDNVLNNAVRFTPPEGQVGVQVAAHGDEIWVSVRNTGEPISPDLKGSIFSKLGELASEQKVSVGLGLSFCKLVAEAHGGRIWAESDPEEGNEFIVALPIGSAPVPSS
jgi:signal transduction histidine kinase